MKRIICSSVLAAILFFLSIPALAKDKADAESASNEIRQFAIQSSLPVGSQISMTVVAPASEEGLAVSAISKTISTITALDSEIFSEGGVENRLNSLKVNTPLTLSPEVFKFISRTVELAALTNGFFDISAPSAKNSFTSRDWRRILLNREAGTVTFKSSGMRIDLKKISYGYYADIAIKELSNGGFANVSVEVGPVCRNIGRDIYTPWNVLIEYGEGKDKNARRALSYNVSDIAAATVTPTGLGANLIDAKNKKRIAGGAVQSITVFAKDASLATAYALVTYTFGPKYGFKFIESHPEVQGIIVDATGKLSVSAGLAETSIQSSPIEASQTNSVDKGPNDLKQKEKEEERDQ